MPIAHLGDHTDKIDTVATWLHEEWGHLSPGSTLAGQVAKLKERCVPGRIPEVFVATENGLVIGTASLVEHDLATHMHLSPWLASVYVQPASRGNGFGTLLVEAAMDESRRLGVETLYLITPDRVSFYQRMGWLPIEVTEYRGETVTVMRYSLAGGEPGQLKVPVQE